MSANREKLEAAALGYTARRLEQVWEALAYLAKDGDASDISAVEYDSIAFAFTCPACPAQIEVTPFRPKVGDKVDPLGFVAMHHPDPESCSSEIVKRHARDGRALARLLASHERIKTELESGENELRLELIRLKRLLDGGDAKPLIPGVMDRGQLAALFGPPKTGKSLLALQWAAELAQSGLRVTYFDEENDPFEVDLRLEAMGFDLGKLRNRLRYHSFAGWSVDTEDGAEQILEHARGQHLVIFDSWAKFFASGSQSDDATANRAYRLTLKPLKAAGVGVLRIDHTGHEETRRPSGTVQKLADVDHNWMIRAKKVARGEPVPVTLTHTENRTGRGEDLITLIREVEPVLRHVPSGQVEVQEVAGVTDGEKVAALVELLDSMSIPTDWPVRAVQDALKKAGKGTRPGVISDAQKARRAS